MPPTGAGKRKVLFVGESPGPTEDSEGTQLIGPAGRKLREILSSIGVDLDDCWKTNSVICFPGNGKKTLPLYMECCRPNLTTTIERLKPKVIVLLGKFAVDSLIPYEWNEKIGDIGRWVGWRIPSQKFNAWICPVYHPSYVLRMQNRGGYDDPAIFRIVAMQVKDALSLEDVPVPKLDIERVRKSVEVVSTVRDSALRLKDLASKSGLLTWDIETNRLKCESKGSRIYSVAMKLEDDPPLSCLLDESCYDALSAVLRNEKLLKIAHNAKYEHRVCLRVLKTRVRGWFWDSQLSAHILDNREGITGLKFQTFVNLGVCYNEKVSRFLKAVDHTENGVNRIDEAPVRDVLEYGGADVVFTERLFRLQRKAFGLT